MNRGNRFGLLSALAAAAPIISPELWSYFRETPRKPPRWKRLGYASEAEYCKRGKSAPEPEQTNDTAPE